MSACKHGANPLGQAAGLPLEPQHVGSGALHQQTPDVLVTSLI